MAPILQHDRLQHLVWEDVLLDEDERVGAFAHDAFRVAVRRAADGMLKIPPFDLANQRSDSRRMGGAW